MDSNRKSVALFGSTLLFTGGVLLLLMRLGCQGATAAPALFPPAALEARPTVQSGSSTPQDEGYGAHPEVERAAESAEYMDVAAGKGDSDESTFDRVAAKHDANDLRLLRAVERITGASPSRDVYELLDMADRGEDVARLRAFIDKHFSKSFRLKHAAVRWLEQREGGPVAPRSRDSGLGRGGAPRRIDAFRHVGSASSR